MFFQLRAAQEPPSLNAKFLGGKTEMKLKKMLAFSLTLALSASMLSGCAPAQEGEIGRAHV